MPAVAAVLGIEAEEQDEEYEDGDEEYDPFSTGPTADADGLATVDSWQSPLLLAHAKTGFAPGGSAPGTSVVLKAGCADPMPFLPPGRRKGKGKGKGLHPHGDLPGPPQKAPRLDSAASVPQQADSWLRRGGASKRPSRNLDSAASLAEEHFGGAEKKLKTEASKPQTERMAAEVIFAPDLLDKAPAVLQTCRSLLLFLAKKLEAELPPKPPVVGPKDLLEQLEAHAEQSGRLAGLRDKKGWDARAKRVLDVNASATAPEGAAALEAAEKALESQASELEKQLQERGEEKALEEATAERRKWAQDALRREWLCWCERLLRAREAALVADSGGADGGAVEAPRSGTVLNALGVFEALLKGDILLRAAG